MNLMNFIVMVIYNVASRFFTVCYERILVSKLNSWSSEDFLRATASTGRYC